MHAYGDNLYHQWIKPDNEDYAFDSSHFDGSNLLFCDGHVKWRRKDSIAASDFGLTSTSVGPVPGATGSAAAF